MAFKKDGEVKVFTKKTGEKTASSSGEEKDRYTIDDLVRDSDKKDSEKKESEDVSN